MFTFATGRELRHSAHGGRAQRMGGQLAFLAHVAMLLVALQCGTAVASAATSPKQKLTTAAAAQLLADGNAAFESGDLAMAVSCWAKIREHAGSTPDWPKAVSNLGLLEYRRKNFREAIAYFGEVLDSHPDDKEPGAHIMETNRNYSHRSALAISQCYEDMGAYRDALRFAWLAKTKYPYYSWCGTCSQSESFAVDKMIAYLTARTAQAETWDLAQLISDLIFLTW